MLSLLLSIVAIICNAVLVIVAWLCLRELRYIKVLVAWKQAESAESQETLRKPLPSLKPIRPARRRQPMKQQPLSFRRGALRSGTVIHEYFD